MTGFAAKILKQTALVYDLRWRDVSGEMAYAIFEADKMKHDAFKRKLDSSDTYDLSDYGTVLYTDFGEPPATLKAELKEKYGMDYD